MKKIVKILAIASNKTIFKADDENWYSCNPEILNNINKNDSVELEFDVDKGKKIVKSITKITEIKNQLPQQETFTPNIKPQSTQIHSKSPEEIRRIMKGNALNASAMALSGTETDPDVLAEKILRLANKLVEWLEI